MKRSEIVMKTDAIMFIVLSGSVLAVSLILVFIGADMIPVIGKAFAILAGIGSAIGFIYNVFNLGMICRNFKGE